MNKVVLLGDSTFARLNRDEKNGFLYLFKEYFPNTEIIDFSQGGANILHGLSQVFSNQLEPQTPIFIMFGTNDAASWKRVPIDEFETSYRKLLDILISSDNTITLITPPPVNVEKQTPPGRLNEDIGEYVEVVKSLSLDYDIKVIDLFKIVGDTMLDKDLHCDDGVHLNKEGYRVLLSEMVKIRN